jgi:hypothetical protein
MYRIYQQYRGWSLGTRLLGQVPLTCSKRWASLLLEMQLRFFESATNMSSSLAKGNICFTTLKADAIQIFKSANLTKKLRKGPQFLFLGG